LLKKEANKPAVTATVTSGFDIKRVGYELIYASKYDKNGHLCEFEGKPVVWDTMGFLEGTPKTHKVRAWVSLHGGPKYQVRTTINGAVRTNTAPTLKRAQLYALEAYSEMKNQ